MTIFRLRLEIAKNYDFAGKFVWVLPFVYIPLPSDTEIRWSVDTSHVCGSLAKWITAGAAKAHKVYLRLPRDAGRTTFLLSARDDVGIVNIPQYLRRFAELFIHRKYTFPTVNLLRKWYHSVLVRLARTEGGLLEVMEKLDGHSVGVAVNHYVLMTPADDANLAKAIVTALLGEPVEWPETRELKDNAAKKAHEKAMALPLCDLEQALPSQASQPGTDVEPEEEEADIELEYVAGLEFFGIGPQLAVLADAEYEGTASGADGETASAADVCDDDPATETFTPRRRCIPTQTDSDAGSDGDDLAVAVVTPTPAGTSAFYDPATQTFKPRAWGIKFDHCQVDDSAWRQQSLSEVGVTGGDQTVTRPQPDPDMRQLSLDTVFVAKQPAKRLKGNAPDQATSTYPTYSPASALKVRRSRLDPDTKAWAEMLHRQEQVALGLSTTQVVPCEWFKTVVQEGIAEGRISSFTTPEGIRSHIRAIIKREKETIEIEKKARKAAQAKERKDKKDQTPKSKGKKDQTSKKATKDEGTTDTVGEKKKDDTDTHCNAEASDENPAVKAEVDTTGENVEVKDDRANKTDEDTQSIESIDEQTEEEFKKRWEGWKGQVTSLHHTRPWSQPGTPKDGHQ